MKVIGIELRVRAGPYRIEAKILPFELELPKGIGFGYYGGPAQIEMTVHTSRGDVTTDVALPIDWDTSSGQYVMSR